MTAKGRYCQQEAFPGIGPKGQERLEKARVLLAGCGALGSAAANLLARAGVGFLRVVDRDILELHNLQRQLLYEEKDLAGCLPKAVLAKKHLERINSSIEVEAQVTHLDPGNILELIEDVDLILDGLDNLQGRYLLNEAAIKTSKPWIFAGAIGASGNVMVVIPGKTPCLCCLFPRSPQVVPPPTCDAAGILGPAATAVAAIEAGEAMKLLAGHRDDLLPGMLTIDLWEAQYRITETTAARREDCPCCGKRLFEMLNGKRKEWELLPYGGGGLQLIPPRRIELDLESLPKDTRGVKILGRNDYLVRCVADGCEMIIFADGRAIVQGMTDPDRARSLYQRLGGIRLRGI